MSIFKTEISYENWASKYKYNNETPIETFQRVAMTLASVEKDKEYWYEKFLRTIVKFNGLNEPVGLKCTPGGRITANIGTSYKKATLINCYIAAPVHDAEIKYKREIKGTNINYDVEYKTDNTPDDLFNIFLTVMEQAKTLASEGGYGINFSFIRPRGSLIKGIGIRHPGVVAYMKIWDAVSECIVKGTNDGYIDKIKDYLKDDEKFKDLKCAVKAQARKGAMMAVLPVSHPDIEEFIRVKQTAGVLTKFNTSILIDDLFMQAVEKDDFYDLHFDGVVYKKVKAKDLYNLIMKSSYNRAEPGVLFYDNMNRCNPLSYVGYSDCVNPCGEIPGLSSITTVCLLGSINLTQYIDKKENHPVFDYDTYKEDVKVLTRMLDNVCDVTYHSLPSYGWVTKNLRQIGIGINGLGSALAMLGISYNSKDALEFAEELCDLKENLTWQTSALLAEEKGVFKVYIREKFLSTPYFKSDKLWKETKKLIRKHGVRNAKTTTNPPLGNSSIICDNVSNGIEPIFSLEYDRKVICKEWPEGLNENNIKKNLKLHIENDYKYWQGEYQGGKYYYEEYNRGLCKIIKMRDYGYQWLLDNFPDKDHSEYLVTSKNLEVYDHVNMQEVIQRHVNQSISKTCNLPKTYSFKKFKDLYINAWKKGLVGFTTYRQGSMESVLSDIERAKDRKILSRDIKLPDTFNNGPTRIIKREGYKFYMHFSYLPEDTKMDFPVVIWIYTNAKYKGEQLRLCNKASRNLEKLALESKIDKRIVQGTVEKANRDYPHNRLGRMISLCLRHNVPREDILARLMNIDGDNVSTLLTAVRKFLSETLKDGTPLRGVLCENPDCTGDRKNVVLESGCKRCLDCDWTACG